MYSLVHVKRQGSILGIEIDNPPVNVFSQQVRFELREAFIAAAADSAVEAVVLFCVGKTFVAGADISEFDLDSIPQPDPNDVFEAIEAMHCPVIAALHGSVLGGGLELALACHYRVALASTRLGLPEVTLGVIPGAGGTQRLPRLAGVEAALDIMTNGAPVSAQRAYELGIVDIVVEDELFAAAFDLARAVIESAKPLRVVSTMPLDKRQIPEGFFDRCRNSLPKVDRGGRAAREIVDCVETGLTLPFGAALERERTAFNLCKNSSESVALRHLFFAEREAARIPGLGSTKVERRIETVGVIGAGTMGSGIAMNFANAGIPVMLVETNDQALKRGLSLVRKSYEASAAKGRITLEQVEKRMALIDGSLAYADIADRDLVIEAAFENMEVKQTICRQLGEICKAGTIIATNTSSLDVNVLASASGRPTDFVGMHFFSPANVMKLLEVVRGDKTSSQVITSVMTLAKKIGKVSVISGVCYGFIGNRMLEGYLREAEFLLLEGANPLQIDRAIEGMGMAMGPCRMIDMAGVDVAAKVVLERQRAGGLPDDPAYRSVVRELFARGRFGQKTSIGYYRYDGRTAIDDPELGALCAELAERHGIVRRSAISDEEIVERCMLPLINEGARILDEGIAYRAGDVDVVWVNGYGFPAYKGGPMHMADVMGTHTILSRLSHFATSRGNEYGYWTASDWLTRRARATNVAS
ncbi:3-hydroxyacyl-CoA dehydrogenase NAD-binding domain-containing protein [Paraburkholderia sp. GAS32]|uniref:3-hydroxyacyl-CoA dehydrogenase NAD-binding domain-containing protein n=1 Tax=Paraburkholderia sp. GAS32 TaxID=3035129 RepID=UPI003D240DCE